MKRFLLIAAFLFVGVLTGCDSLQQDSNDDNDGRSSGDDTNTTTMVVPVAPAIELYA